MHKSACEGKHGFLAPLQFKRTKFTQIEQPLASESSVTISADRKGLEI